MDVYKRTDRIYVFRQLNHLLSAWPSLYPETPQVCATFCQQLMTVLYFSQVSLSIPRLPVLENGESYSCYFQDSHTPATITETGVTCRSPDTSRVPLVFRGQGECFLLGVFPCKSDAVGVYSLVCMFQLCDWRICLHPGGFAWPDQTCHLQFNCYASEWPRKKWLTKSIFSRPSYTAESNLYLKA